MFPEHEATLPGVPHPKAVYMSADELRAVMQDAVSGTLEQKLEDKLRPIKVELKFHRGMMERHADHLMRFSAEQRKRDEATGKRIGELEQRAAKASLWPKVAESGARRQAMWVNAVAMVICAVIGAGAALAAVHWGKTPPAAAAPASPAALH